MNNERDKKEFQPEHTVKTNWSAFIESTVANFFTEHDLQKMTLEDGNGNKAKLSMTKDGGIKVEHSSVTIL